MEGSVTFFMLMAVGKSVAMAAELRGNSLESTT